MSGEHWQRFQKQERARLAESSMPIDAVELERLRRRQNGLCSVKSLFCCLSVLVGKPSALRSAKGTTKRQTYRRSLEDDDSFGYNFDDEQISPRVLSRLATGGHDIN
ncbi:hypothetical protein ACHAXA_002649 [Cyclostephanos tholiformis]|jgi:hypothetical protein|uniref:Uncharacterized protein n=1 Tax=Cyclostephanos tholiformis TaxID=382380 RepID=A0ABD3SCS9_9STRA